MFSLLALLRVVRMIVVFEEATNETDEVEKEKRVRSEDRVMS